MNAPWFTFSFSDFSYAFLSVLLEGVPFILLGTIFSGFIDQFLPSRLMVRLLPRNAFLGICVSAGLGMIFPMCECGIVPVIRRLMNKGLPVSNAVAYMLAAPVVNPIVAISTYVAFGRGQFAVEFTVLRLGLSFAVAVIAALAVHQLPISSVLRVGVVTPNETESMGDKRGNPLQRIGGALGVAVSDFLDVMMYFIIGVAVSATFTTSLNQEIIMPLALNDAVAVFSMMGFATILSLCSTSDAFIAATFVAFPAVSKLAFLVFGPVLDLKLIFMYSAVFKKRFVAGLAIGLFVLIGLMCLRLKVINLGLLGQ